MCDTGFTLNKDDNTTCDSGMYITGMLTMGNYMQNTIMFPTH